MKRRNALPKKQGLWGDVLHRFLRNRMAVFGAIVMILLILCALLAPLIAPYGYDDQDASIAKQPPGPGDPFGTDNFGGDILSRIIYGSQIFRMNWVILSILILCALAVAQYQLLLWAGNKISNRFQ